MILLLILMLSGLVSVWSQSTLLDSQCDGDCRYDVEIQRLVAIMEGNMKDTNDMRRNMVRMEESAKEANERSEKKIMELSDKNEALQNQVEGLESKVTELANEYIMTDTRIQRLESEVQNQNDTIHQLQAELSELKSKNQTSNVDGSMNFDCEDLRARGYLYSGVYEVNVNNVEKRRVYCEMTSDSKPWTRILHRQDNLTDFTYKKWAEYEAGFGDPQGSHWMGLVQMHQLTTSREYKMRVDLMDWEGATRFAEYTTFRVGAGSDKYRLTIGGYSGTAGDSMGFPYHHDMMFSTIDSDNDGWSAGHCAGGTGRDTGGWWYNSCALARLTGTYFQGGGRVSPYHGIQWKSWRGAYYSYKVATMKVQRL